MVQKSRSKKFSPSTGVAFGRKKGIWDNDLNEWMVKEVARDVWLTFENSIKSSASKTHFHAENERVSRLTVFFSCNVVSPDNIYANNFSENLIEWVESLTQLTEQPDEQRSFTDWRVNHLVWMHEVVTCVIKLTMAKLTCITKQEIPEIVRQSCSFYWISRPLYAMKSFTVLVWSLCCSKASWLATDF